MCVRGAIDPELDDAGGAILNMVRNGIDAWRDRLGVSLWKALPRMIYETNLLAIIVFAVIVLATLGLSFYLGSKAKSSEGFFAAGGSIPWFVNGIAFAGDYLSAASFLGICGMIAFYGYDGFLYSIGYLAGWVVALLVIAEPLKRMGKYTFADALDSRFGSKGIKFAASVSTLLVSIFYLIPQMVGAGALVKPLLGLPYWAGVILVGGIVILIVCTAGMDRHDFESRLESACI
jgi:cation/acetate symporter